MNCPQEAQALLPMMAATRGGFERLEQDLVQSMVMQAVTGVTAGLASQAQHLIDTLVRNLYERTADVGFLATDAMLCQFMAAADGDEAAITQRLRAYRSKYTVYADILLLDAEGQVRASAREESGRRSAMPGCVDCPRSAKPGLCAELWCHRPAAGPRQRRDLCASHAAPHQPASHGRAVPVL
jgi:hypothetical protein